MTCDLFEVVVVPFPFTDTSDSKRRPALVVSEPEAFGDVIGHSVLAMVTSAKNVRWPLDTEIEDLEAAGLRAPSVVRMKLFTLDHRLILRSAGRLAAGDAERVREALARLLGS